MFEDLENFMSRNRKKPSGDKKNNHDDDEQQQEPTATNSSPRAAQIQKRLRQLLQNEFGDAAELMEIKEVPGGTMGMLAMKEPQQDDMRDRLRASGLLKQKITGIAASLEYLALAAKAKPSFCDATGQECKVGDKLKVPGGSIKVVLRVGFKFAVLSHTDNHAVEDGIWFEEEIKTLNFIKQ